MSELPCGMQVLQVNQEMQERIDTRLLTKCDSHLPVFFVQLVQSQSCTVQDLERGKVPIDLKA